MGELGDFQQGVGEVSGTAGVIGSYIIAGIFFILAVLFGVFAVIKSRSGSGFKCSKDSDCVSDDESCLNGECFQRKETRHPWLLLLSLLFILLGIGIIWFSKSYNKWIHKSRRNAQIAGAFTEFNIAMDLLHHN